MTNAAQGSTKAQPAVIDTAPPRRPFPMAAKSNLYSLFYPVIYFLKKKAVIPAEDGAMIVLTIAREAASQPSPGFDKPKDEPPLKNIHPTQRIKVPRTILFGLYAWKPLSCKVDP